MSGLLLVVGKLRQLHKALVVVSCHGKFDLLVLPCEMHPALSPFSQPKTSHQSSKLHPDPDCAVLCRYPMWRPFPSLFRNNWPCCRHSDAAARSHTLDSTCSSGVLTPQPPAFSWTVVVVGSPSQDSATLPTSNSPKAMRTQSRLSKQDDCLSISHVGGSNIWNNILEMLKK